MKFSRLLVAVAILAAAQDALAAGIYLTPRGVRPIARGGAFVAGADDTDAMWYNPAGLMEAGGQFDLDLAYINANATYFRQSYVAAGSTGEPMTINDYPRVDGAAPFLPIPALGGTYNFGLEDWNFGAGLSVPYGSLIDYPETVLDPAQNNRQVASPQRYSLITPRGTVLGTLGLFGARTFLNKKLHVGLGFRLSLGTFTTTTALSSCPGPVLCSEQDPDYDSVTQVSSFIVAPSASLGAIYKIDDIWRVGLSFDLPTWVDMPATVKTRLPQAPIFSGAAVEGDSARLKLQLPFIARAGVEARPMKQLRIELAVVFEGWSIHDNIRIQRPSPSRGVDLVNVIGFPQRYPIGDLQIERRFRDTFSVRLGAEWLGGAEPRSSGLHYRLRAGVMFERSAVPNEYYSVLSDDPDKLMPAIGASIGVSGFRLDVSYAAVIGFPVTVDPATARLYATNPVRAEEIDRVAINGGKYYKTAHVIGIGFNYQFK